MKKILLILILFVLAGFVNKGYCSVVVQHSGTTVVTTNQVSRIISTAYNNSWNMSLDVSVKALDPFITSSNVTPVNIPISKLYLSDGINDYQMIKDTEVKVINAYSLTPAGYTKQFNAIIKGVGALPPGDYSTKLQFITNSVTLPTATIFTLSFTVPLNQSVSATTNPINIKLTPDDVFQTSVNIDGDTPQHIYVQSNGQWQIQLDTTGMEPLNGKYFFLVTGVSPNVTGYINTQTEILPNKVYTLAYGNPTVTDPITGGYANDYINMKYTFKHNSSSYIPEGTFTNNFCYKIIGRNN